MPHPKTLIFDLGNVIVPFDFTRAYRRFEELTGIPPEEQRARIAATGLVPKLETGLIEPEDFVDKLTAALGAPMSYADFRDLWVSIFHHETLIPESLFVSLASRYRLVLLSNTNAIHFDMIRENYPHLGHFDHWVLSHEVKAMKPSPAIYAAAIEHAHALPEECFFTDDIPEYVAGARAAGIDAEQFLGYDKLLSDLRTRGVEV